MSEVPIVILTAMNLEYDEVRARLSGIVTHTHRAGTRFEVGRMENNGYRAALALTGKGNHPAAVLAERAIAEFAPDAMVFAGVAGALQPHVDLGDVVVATYVYAYHGGTGQDDGLQARPRTWELSHRVHQLAAHLDRRGGWVERQSGTGVRSRVHFGPIAAGEIALYSDTSGERQWLREHYSDAVAVEMEAAGIAQAGHLNDSLPTVMVRGISDPADSGKASADRAGWQPRAAANAAAFAVALAGLLAEELGGDRDGSPQPPAAGLERDGTHVNIATGNAQVGVQARDVAGGIRFGPEAGGTLVSSGGVLRHPSGRGKLRTALSWLYGLTGNVTDLAASVASIMSAIRNLT